jgi:hypothetical protein
LQKKRRASGGNSEDLKARKVNRVVQAKRRATIAGVGLKRGIAVFENLLPEKCNRQKTAVNAKSPRRVAKALVLLKKSKEA